MSYPREDLIREVAYMAYHFHWNPDDIMELDHFTRHEFIEQISDINRKINKGKEEY